MVVKNFSLSVQRVIAWTELETWAGASVKCRTWHWMT